MSDIEFDALFGKTGPDGHRPTICAATERPLRNTDHVIRQRIAGTPYYVMHTAPLSDERLASLTKQAEAGAKARPKPQANKES